MHCQLAYPGVTRDAFQRGHGVDPDRGRIYLHVAERKHDPARLRGDLLVEEALRDEAEHVDFVLAGCRSPVERAPARPGGAHESMDSCSSCGSTPAPRFRRS